VSSNIRKINPLQSALIRIVNATENDDLYWPEDLRPAWNSTLSALGCMSSTNLSGMEKVLRCFDSKVTVIPPFSFDFASHFNVDNPTPNDDGIHKGDTPKAKQSVKPKPIRKAKAKAQEMVVEGDNSAKPGTGPSYDEGKHTMNVPKVRPKLYA
jgi:hypothetical protein